MDEIILELKKVNKYYPGVQALKDIDLTVKTGEIHAICGENGAGKSTVTKIIAGVESPSNGEIIYEGKQLTKYSVAEAQNMGIFRVPQELEIVDNLNVAQNIYLSKLPVKSLGMVDNDKLHKDAKEILKQLDFEIDTKKKLKNLLIGQQQMVAIAKALAMNPRIIIFDEPTSSLSKNEIEKLMNEIIKLKKKGIAVLYITHKLEEVMQISDKVTVMRDGGQIITTDTKNITMDEIISNMIGRDLTELYPKENIEIGATIFEVKNIVGNMVKNNSFYLRKGEILGMYGLVGSGRTEMMTAIFGADKMDSGKVILHNVELKIKSPKDAIMNGIALVPENRRDHGIIADVNVKENISLADIKNLSNWTIINKKKETNVVADLVKNLDLQPPYLDTEVRYLSGGNQQKVVIGKWLCRKSKLIIFDEPTKGVDVGAKAEIYKMMEQMAKEGVGVIFISSEMPELIGICDRILIFNEGSISGSVNREDFTEEKILSLAITKEV